MYRTTLALAASGLLFACGGSQTTPDESATKMSAATDKDLPAPCTGTVPDGATNCLLDLATGTDSHWSDTDGVDPGTAGCHYEFTDATCGEFKEGRTFGELCLDDDRLVESNPGADECHTHGGDMGKPDVVSCSTWCAEQGQTAGKCESGVPASGKHGSCESARCVCG